MDNVGVRELSSPAQGVSIESRRKTKCGKATGMVNNPYDVVRGRIRIRRRFEANNLLQCELARFSTSYTLQKPLHCQTILPSVKILALGMCLVETRPLTSPDRNASRQTLQQDPQRRYMRNHEVGWCTSFKRSESPLMTLLKLSYEEGNNLYTDGLSGLP